MPKAKRAPRASIGVLALLSLLALLALGRGCLLLFRGPQGPVKHNYTPGAAIPTPRARAIYVTNDGSDSLSVIDRDGTSVTTVPVDVDPNEKEAPHHLAVNPAAGVGFVLLSFPAPPKIPRDPHSSHGGSASFGTLVRVDLDSLAITDFRDLDYNPGDIVLTRDRKRVLVTHFDLKRASAAPASDASPESRFASLQVFDADKMYLLGVRPVCVAPHGIATTLDDKLAIVACYGSDEIALVDLTRPDLLRTSRVPLAATGGAARAGVPRYGPDSVAVAPDGRRAVVATLEASDLRVFDLDAKRFVPDATVALGARAFFPEFVDAAHVLVPTQAPDGLVRVDVDHAHVEARAPWGAEACRAPHVVRRSANGRLFVVCEGDHVAPGAVVEINPTSLAIVKTWTVGVYPDGLAFGD